ncbi:MAG: hypothetical protein ACP5VF_03700 [Acidobacteriota bacterium]
MKKPTTLILAALVAAALPLTALAAGGGPKTGASPKTSYTNLTVTIPGVVGIDIETDLTWDFGSYPAGKISSPSPNNLFPPPPFNTAAAYWTPTAATTTSGAPAPAPTWTAPAGTTGAAAIWMAVFCNINTGTLTFTSTLGSWSASDPFSGTVSVQEAGDTSNNAFGIGGTSWASLSSTATSLTKGTATATFNWTRADQLFQLYTNNVGTATFVPGTYTNTVTISIAKG